MGSVAQTTKYYALRFLAHVPRLTLSIGLIVAFFSGVMALKGQPWWILVPVIFLGSGAMIAAVVLAHKLVDPERWYPATNKPTQHATFGEFMYAVSAICFVAALVVVVLFGDEDWSDVWTYRLSIGWLVSAVAGIIYTAGRDAGEKSEREFQKRLREKENH